MTSFSSDRRLFLFSRERTAIFWCSSNVSHFCGVIRWYNRDIRLQSLGVSTSANVIIVCFIRGRSEVLPSRFVFYVLFRQSSPWLNIEREVFHTYIFSIILLDFDFNNEEEDIFAGIFAPGENVPWVRRQPVGRRQERTSGCCHEQVVDWTSLGGRHNSSEQIL